MADINHGSHEPARVEGDGINYRGLAISMIVLTAVTLVCYGIVVVLFNFMESRAVSSGEARAPLAAPATHPSIIDGRLAPGNTTPTPNLLVNEPMNLAKFRAQEEHILTSFSWMDQNAGTIRIPIAQAKDMLLERGLPTRNGVVTPAEPVKEVK
jgi:hypothetical protein